VLAVKSCSNSVMQNCGCTIKAVGELACVFVAKVLSIANDLEKPQIVFVTDDCNTGALKYRNALNTKISITYGLIQSLTHKTGDLPTEYEVPVQDGVISFAIHALVLSDLLHSHTRSVQSQNHSPIYRYVALHFTCGITELL